MLDFKRITHRYDQFAQAVQTINTTSTKLKSMLENTNEYLFENIIIGTGDAGTTAWLEILKKEHCQTNSLLKNNKLPKVLMIAKDMGCWKHDYTLAQPYSLLERSRSLCDAKDFVTTKSYENNGYVNARHLYQGNVISLAVTQAPIILDVEIISLEIIDNHKNEDWTHPNANYRLNVLMDAGQDPSNLKEIFKEVVNETLLARDLKTAMPLGIKSRDDAIYFLGAAAMAVGPDLYSAATRTWTLAQNINADAEWPGVMPPSRSQIAVLATFNDAPTAINLNMDDIQLVNEFLSRSTMNKEK
uniref:Uncharacterized protein n=1 Tax=Ditylenchus dipsaci TaxID=166011 RepID=A0A915EQ49_9BILA